MNIILYEPFCSSAGRTKRPFLPIDKQIMCKTFLVHTSICGKRTPPRQPAGAEPTYKILIFIALYNSICTVSLPVKIACLPAKPSAFSNEEEPPPAREAFPELFLRVSKTPRGQRTCVVPAAEFHPRPRSEETAAHGTVILFPSFGIVKRLDIGMYRIERRQEIERLHPFGQQYEYGIIA